MILEREWLFGSDWGHTFGMAGVSVLLLSLIAGLVSRGLRNSPAVRDTTLLSALAACLTIPAVALVVIVTGVPLVSLPVNGGASSRRASTDMSAHSETPAAGTPQTRSEHAVSISRMRPHGEADADDAVADERRSPIITPSLTTIEPPVAPAPIIRGIDAGVMIALGWLTGTVLLTGFALRSGWRASRIRRRACLPETSRHLSIAQAAAITVGIRKHPAILESTEVSTPVVIGFRFPAVVLPRWVFETVSDGGLRDIFIHEFAHVRRGDQWAVCAQAAAPCLFWPVVTIHWLNRAMSRSREEVCDNFVLAHQDAIEYGELLLKLAQRAIGRRPIDGTIGILNWEGQLEGRVARILDPQANRATASSSSAKVLLASAFLLAGTALCGTRFVAAELRGNPMSATNEAGPVAAQPPQPEPKPSTVDSLGDPLPEHARLRLGTSRFRPPSGVTDLALSPDETALVSAGDQLIVWDPETGKERWRADAGEFGFDFRGARYGSRAVAFSSDSSRFYTPGGRNKAIVWETTSGRHETLTIKPPGQTVKERQGAFQSIDVTPDGKSLAVGGADGIIVCDREGEVLFEIANAPEGPLKLDDNDRLTFFGHYSFGRFSPNGTILAVVTSDRPEEVRIYEVENGRELRKIALASWLVRLDFSPNGRQIAATERDSAVRLYDVESGKRVWSQVIQLTNPYENYTSAVAFSPDGKIVAAGATDLRLYLIDASTGEQMAQLTGHAWNPWALAFAANSKLLYSSGWDGAIRRWDVAARKQLALPAGVRATGVVAASPDGGLLAYADDSGAIRLVAADNGTERRTIQLPGVEYSHLIFSPDGQRLAGGGASGDNVHVAVWTVPSGELLYRWDWPKGRDPHCTAESLCFTPDGNRLAAEVFRQSAAYVWDLTNGQRLAQLAHKEVYGLSFSPDGKTLATAGWDSVIRFWATDNWELRREFALSEIWPRGVGGDLRMYAVRYAPEGGLIATAHIGGGVRIWQADGMLLRTHFAVQNPSHGAVTFSPDGLWLATGDGGGNVELWDPLTGKKVWDGGRHQGHLYMVSFGRDARTLASGSDEDGLCYLWDLRPPGNDLPNDLDRLWYDLAGEDAGAAYQAMWALSNIPDRAVALLTEKLQLVTSVVDPDRIGEGESPEENQRLKRMKRLRAEIDPNVELAVTIRRAVSLLAQLGTPAATRLLQDLAERDSDGEIGQFARAALKRVRIDKR